MPNIFIPFIIDTFEIFDLTQQHEREKPYTLNYLIYVIMMLIYKWYNYLNILVARIFTPRKLLSNISLFNIAAKSKEKKNVLFVAIEMSTLVHKEFLKSRVIKSTNDIYLTKRRKKSINAFSIP